MRRAVAPGDRVVWALRRASQSVEARKEQRLRSTGLGGAHYPVLMSVAMVPGITGAELARRLRVTPQNVAALVVKLADRGLLERRPDALRPHLLTLHLTAEGTRVLAEADAVVAEVEREVVALLGAADATALRESLERVALGMTQPL